MTSRGNVSFALHGTAKAMDRVVNCASELASRTTPSATVQARFAPVPASDAAVLLTNLFNTARLQGYTLKAAPAGQNNVYFAMADGRFGTFFAFTGDTLSADEAASIAISSDAEKCTGEFLSGKRSVPSTDGTVVRKVVTTCRTNGNAVLHESTIVRKSDGFLFNLTVVQPEGNSVVPEEDASKNDRDKSLMDAALRLQR